jgi:hypothetical protein
MKREIMVPQLGMSSASRKSPGAATRLQPGLPTDTAMDRGALTTEHPSPEGQPMLRTIHGRVHGKTIELDEDLYVADG